MTAKARQIADLPPNRIFHRRVDGAFLPISVRQNRIEDVFAHFLRNLAPLPNAPMPEEDAESKAREILDLMTARNDRFRLPARAEDRELIFDWIRQELLVESRASNRLARDAASLIPMHLAVGQRFEPRSNPPDYGGMLSELLAVGEGAEPDLSTLDSLKGFMESSEDDLIARVLQGTLWIQSNEEPGYRSLTLGRFVACKTHARNLKSAVAHLLSYKEMIARRTFVNWLFSTIDFFLATYFLRMALAAEYFGGRIERIMSHKTEDPDLLDWEDPTFQPTLVYGKNNPEHARLMKRYPYYTSMLLLVTALASALDDADVTTRDWSSFEQAAERLSHKGDLDQILKGLAEAYPITEDLGRTWKLTAADRSRILDASTSSPFVTLALLLNFEDMARRTNNVMEWQFYAALARDRAYGFARPKRGDSLIYELSHETLGAFVHIFCASSPDPTFSAFTAYLETLGFSFDGKGRLRLEEQLVENGLVNELADAGEAKYLTPMYKVGSLESA